MCLFQQHHLQGVNKHFYFLHCFKASLIHFDNHFVEGRVLFVVSPRAFSIKPSHTDLTDEGANSWIKAQSNANALNPSSVNYHLHIHSSLTDPDVISLHAACLDRIVKIDYGSAHNNSLTVNKAFFIILKELGGMARSASRRIMHTRRIAETTSGVGHDTAESITAYVAGEYWVVLRNSL